MSKTFKIAAFTYDFPHYRSQMGILKLMYEDMKPDVLLAQEWKKLNFYQSKIRFSPEYTDVPETRDIAKLFNIDYVVGDHNSEEVIDEVKKRNIDVGVILGARILSKDIINAFNIGVINLHPGIIPINRGLDNLKWAIHDRIPQAVTSHLIAPEIDMGNIIDLQIMDVHEDDTLIDMHIRQQELMHKMMAEAIAKLADGFEPVPQKDEGTYHGAIPPELEKDFMEKVEPYKKEYASIVEEWKNSQNN